MGINKPTLRNFLVFESLIGLVFFSQFKVLKEILWYTHEIYNINDWSFFLVRKFTNFPKKNLLIYIKLSKSNYQLKFEEKCKKSWKFNFWPLSPKLWVKKILKNSGVSRISWRTFSENFKKIRFLTPRFDRKSAIYIYI